MGVGQDVAVRGKNESRSDGLLLEIALSLAASGILAEALEEFVERVVFGQIRKLRALDRLSYVDADDRRTLLLVELGEVRQTAARLGRRCRREQCRAEQCADHRPDAKGQAASPVVFVVELAGRDGGC